MFGGRPTRRQSWLRIVIGLALLALGAYSVWQSRNARSPVVENGDAGNGASTQIEMRRQVPAENRPTGNEKAATDTIVPSQTIYDLDGNVAFRGDIDLTATLARIRTGERLQFRNDGSTFENRERRLPRQPVGYYQEYVHPTAGLDGPGPQRVVIGKEGEAYYTPDHYRSFQRVNGDE
jgi:filamentous hemagglutinin